MTQAVIFDLDDTLYSEKEYVRSGFRAVSKILTEIENACEKLYDAFSDGEPAIDFVLKKENVYDNDLKSLCLETYRNHLPEIHLYDGVKELLEL